MVKAIAIIGIRLLALNWLFLGISVVIFIPFEISDQSAKTALYYAFFLTSGILCWVFANKLAGAIVSSEPQDGPITDFSVSEIVGAGSFLIGLYLFVTHIGSLLYRLIMFSDATYNIGSIVLQLIQPIIVVVLSLFLIFGHRRFFVNLFNFIRNADTKVYKVED